MTYILQVLVTALLISSIFVLTSINVSALTSYIVFYTGYRQAKSNWCWVASAETSAKYITSSKQDQYSAVRYLKGTNTNPYPVVGGNIYDIAKAANYISGNKYSYVGSSKKCTSFFFINQLNAKKFLVVGLIRSLNNEIVEAHAVPVFGIFIYSDTTITIGYYNPSTGDTPICTFNEFCNGTPDNWRYNETCYIE